MMKPVKQMRGWEALLAMTPGGLYYAPEMARFLAETLIETLWSSARLVVQKPLIVSDADTAWHVAGSPAESGSVLVRDRFAMQVEKSDGQISEFGFGSHREPNIRIPSASLLVDCGVASKLAEMLFKWHWGTMMLDRQRPLIVRQTGDECQVRGTPYREPGDAWPVFCFVTLRKSDGYVIDFGCKYHFTGEDYAAAVEAAKRLRSG
jgi:hypothetical protein